MLILPLGPEDDDLRGVASERGLATYSLLGLCGLVFLLCAFFLEGREHALFLQRWGFDADSMLGPGLLTHQFLHSDWLHLLGNGLFLLVFGITVERRLGPLAVVAVFLLSGMCGAWVYGLTAQRVVVLGSAGEVLRVYPPLVGASGAIMGLVGCLLPTMPSLRVRVLVGFHVWWRVVAVPAWVVAGAFFCKEFVGALLQSPEAGTAYAAHLGGIVGGALVAFLVPPLNRMEKRLQERVQEALGSRSLARLAPPAYRGSLAASLPGEWPEHPCELSKDSAEFATLGFGEVNAAESVSISTEVEIEGGGGDRPDFGSLPVNQDLTQVSGVWAPNWQLADLQDRFTRSRRLERRTDKARLAFTFYMKVLRDEELPPGYRAYAGARACRMLLRGGRFSAALSLARKLLRNQLAGELQTHVEETARHARRRITRERATPSESGSSTESESEDGAPGQPPEDVP